MKLLQYSATVILCSMLVSCTKQEVLNPDPQKKPETMWQAGFTKDIDVYKPGNYWVYYWTELGYNGEFLRSGYDTIKVMSTDTTASTRSVFGTVHGQLYTAVYTFTDSGISYPSDPVQHFYFSSSVYIKFDSSDVLVDYPLNPARGGCNIYMYRNNYRNVPCRTAAGDFITIKDSYNVAINGGSGGCYGAGYQKTHYARTLGEVYRVTSYPMPDSQLPPVHYTRELVSYFISS